MARNVQAGERTAQLTFQARAAGVDANGRPNGAWQAVDTDPTVWAKPAYVGASDIAAAGQLQATLDAQFIVPYRTDIQPGWRALVDDQPFEIIGRPMPVDGGRQWLLLRCTAGVRAGR